MLEQHIQELTLAVKALTAAINEQSAAASIPVAAPVSEPAPAKAEKPEPKPAKSEAPKPAEPEAKPAEAKAEPKPAEPKVEETKPEPEAKVEEAKPAEPELVEEAATAEAPAPAPSTDAASISEEQMKEYIKKAFSLCGGAPITTALHTYGKAKLPEVPQEDYPKLLALLIEACPDLEA
jgi:outer membrane biosynthesis protein TonB